MAGDSSAPYRCQEPAAIRRRCRCDGRLEGRQGCGVLSAAKASARPWDGGAAEVERVAARVEDHFHHVRVEQVGRSSAARGRRWTYWRRCCRSRAAATSRINPGAMRGSSPWTLTTMVSSGQPHVAATSAMRSVPEYVARRRHQAADGPCSDDRVPAPARRRWRPTPRPRRLPSRASATVHHHRFAGDVQQRLAGQARRGVTGRDDDYEVHVSGDAVMVVASGGPEQPS